MNINKDYYPEDASKLPPEVQFTLKKISVSIRKLSHEQLINHFMDTMVLFLRLKVETNKLMEIMDAQKKLAGEALLAYKTTITGLKSKVNTLRNNDYSK